jgi:hypothetical protein
MNSHKTFKDMNPKYQKVIYKSSVIQQQDKVQQYVNDTSARIFAETEAIIAMCNKSFQPKYLESYGAQAQDIQKRMTNLEVANLTLKIQINQGSKDPEVPPIRVATIPAAHLQQTIKAAWDIEHKGIRKFVLETLDMFQTKVVREEDISIPSEYSAPKQSSKMYEENPQIIQEEIMRESNKAHGISSHLETRIQKSLPSDDSRYLPASQPLITPSEARGIIGTCQQPHSNWSSNHTHHDGRGEIMLRCGHLAGKCFC